MCRASSYSWLCGKSYTNHKHTKHEIPGYFNPSSSFITKGMDTTHSVIEPTDGDFLRAFADQYAIEYGFRVTVITVKILL